MTITESKPLTAESVRAALAAEWTARAPSDPESIAAFYRDCPAELLANDLEMFHALELRKRWTHILVELARKADGGLVVDIGSGDGCDLRALLSAGVGAVGVEPNDGLRIRCRAGGLTMYRDVAQAPIESASILNCIDVLEHVPDPETWLGAIAQRAKVGSFLLETSATWDQSTPLHLPENRGWAPGRVLQSCGWDRIATHDRMSCWQRFEAPGPICQTYIVVCTSSSLSIKTHQAILALMRSDDGQFNWVPSEATEAGLLRARSSWASKWYRDTCSDGFLMVDADMGFTPQDAMHIAQVGREKQSIVVGAYPTKDGKNLTIKPLEDPCDLLFGPDQPPLPIRWGATGYMWVPRVVLDAMVPTIPLCNAVGPHAFWPFFSLDLTETDDGEWNLLLDDFGFCERARRLGFTVWLDPTIQVDHWNGTIPVNYRNMQQVASVAREDS